MTEISEQRPSGWKEPGTKCWTSRKGGLLLPKLGDGAGELRLSVEGNVEPIEMVK